MQRLSWVVSLVAMVTFVVACVPPRNPTNWERWVASWETKYFTGPPGYPYCGTAWTLPVIWLDEDCLARTGQPDFWRAHEYAHPALLRLAGLGYSYPWDPRVTIEAEYWAMCGAAAVTGLLDPYLPYDPTRLEDPAYLEYLNAVAFALATGYRPCLPEDAARITTDLKTIGIL